MNLWQKVIKLEKMVEKLIERMARIEELFTLLCEQEADDKRIQIRKQMIKRK